MKRVRDKRSVLLIPDYVILRLMCKERADLS